MNKSLVKFTLGSLAALALAITPAQAAVMINQLLNDGATPESATNKYLPNAAYGSWVVPPNVGSNVWNSWGLGVDGTATTAGGLVFTTNGANGTLSLNLSTFNAIQIDAKALAGNTVTAFNVVLYSSHVAGHPELTAGTVLKLNLASVTDPGSTQTVLFSTGIQASDAGSLANLSAINEYQIQGDNWGTPTAFAMQYTNLEAVPEPATWALMGIAGTGVMVVRRIRSRRES